MRVCLRRCVLLLLGLVFSLSIGCGDEGTVTPVQSEQKATSEAPPPGREPTLPEEGP